MGTNTLLKKGIVFHPTTQQKNFTCHFINDMPDILRGQFDGTYLDRYVGILGQKILSDFLNTRSPENPTLFDNGRDIQIGTKKYDVKTIQVYTKKCLDPENIIYFIYRDQVTYDNNGYFFLTFLIEQKNFIFGGFLKKDDIYRKGIYHDTGETIINTKGYPIHVKAPCYTINGRGLEDFTEHTQDFIDYQQIQNPTMGGGIISSGN